MPDRDRLQKQIQRLSLADKQALQSWLSEEIEEESQPPTMAPTISRDVVETSQVGHITYQSELVRCGKPTTTSPSTRTGSSCCRFLWGAQLERSDSL